jgi:UDP-glucose 4-epimerase
MTDSSKSVLITGAGGYLGGETVKRLHKDHLHDFKAIVALDVRETPEDQRLDGITYVTGDIRDEAIVDHFRNHAITHVVHLASIVRPGGDRAFDFSVDVTGTENILKACLEAGVRHLLYTSSGAAYGYYPDNNVPLHEDDPIRGNEEFSYSDHKRIVEHMLADYREKHPDLKQLILRPGTILGATTDNRITKLFENAFILGLVGESSPFSFVWDDDVAQCVVKGVVEDKEGVYNVAGDGTMSMREIATALKKPYVPIPVPVLSAILWVAHTLGISQYGPEQILFLRYRPVLGNDKLKAEFGYTPQMTTRQAFGYYHDHGYNRHGKGA